MFRFGVYRKATRQQPHRFGVALVALLLGVFSIGSGLVDRSVAQTANRLDKIYRTNEEPLYYSNLHGYGNQPIMLRTNNAMVTNSGQVPAISRISTSDPVIFIGIDDGWTKSPEASQWLKRHKLPVSLFLTDDSIEGKYAYFSALQSNGINIQNHTLHHPHLTTLNYEQQKQEICATSDFYARQFGRRPTLFRPPYGEYDSNTKRAVAACGMRAIILWHAKADGGTIQFQTDSNHLQAGDILLMHFRPKFVQDIESILAAASQQNLVVADLEDYIH